MSPIDESELINRFNYHPATTEKRQADHASVRRLLLQVSTEFATHLPAGREQSLALTKLEEAMFWANAAIARQPEPAAPTS